MDEKNLLRSPKQLFLEITNFLNNNDLGYIILAIAVAVTLYAMIVFPRIKFVATWKRLVASIVSLLAWFFIMYIVMWPKMKFYPIFSIPLLASGVLFAFVSTYIVLFRVMGKKDASIWNRVIAGSILGITVFSILGLFAFGKATYSYALVMGVILGVLVAQIIYNSKKVGTDITEEMAKIKKNKEKYEIPDL